MILTIIITTKNEAGNIGECINVMKWVLASGEAEIVVVDNHSTDKTADIARGLGIKVILCGPERSAQRNRGAAEGAGDYIFYVDADMRVKRDTLEEILELLKSAQPPDALYVRESIAGSGYWNRMRNFERSFYDATCIDGLRVIRKSLFMEIGGFDESLCGPEDWDLDRRILQKTAKVRITRNSLIHDEGAFSLWRNLRKKNYYSRNIGRYMEKWNNDETAGKQVGVAYRFWTVFVENGKWKRAILRPDLMFCIWSYRVLVGLAYVHAKISHR